MKLFAPKYYKDFKCIADKCRHSCCVGWEIDVDRKSIKKYSSLTGGYGEVIKESIDTDGEPHFRLGEGERCPHLDGRGLCRIITELGEEYLCDICREHPRFYNDVACGKEVGIGMACEEACRVILSSDGYDEMTVIGELKCKATVADFDTRPRRKKIYGILSSGDIPHAEKLLLIENEFGVSPNAHSDSEWRELLTSLEYLDEAHRELFSCYSSNPQTPKSLEKPFERALAYFVYRHCSGTESEDDFRAALGLCLFLERQLASVVTSSASRLTGATEELARIVSEEIEYSDDNTETIKQEFLF